MAGGPSEKVQSKKWANRLHVRLFHHVIACLRPFTRTPSALFAPSSPRQAGICDLPALPAFLDHGGAVCVFLEVKF